jgi:hypothetical protein
MGTRGSFSGAKAAGRWSWPLASIKEWVALYFHSPNTPSWRGTQLKHRDNFTFTLSLGPIYFWVWNVLSSVQVPRLQFCMHLSCHPCVLHVSSISSSLILLFSFLYPPIIYCLSVPRSANLDIVKVFVTFLKAKQLSTKLRLRLCEQYQNFIPVSCIRGFYMKTSRLKLSLCFNWAPRHEDVLGEWRYSSTHSLTSALDGGEWSASRPGRFTSSEIAPGTHWIGGWVGTIAGLDAVVKRKIPSPHRDSNPRSSSP